MTTTSIATTTTATKKQQQLNHYNMKGIMLSLQTLESFSICIVHVLYAHGWMYNQRIES